MVQGLLSSVRSEAGLFCSKSVCGTLLKEGGYYGDITSLENVGGADECAALAHKKGFKTFALGQTFFEGKCLGSSAVGAEGEFHDTSLYDFYSVTVPVTAT